MRQEKQAYSFQISIHAPHARCDNDGEQGTKLIIISIHAPHARCDPKRFANIAQKAISIHAPHARCDIVKTVFDREMADFNPRTPCEVRLFTALNGVASGEFQSTHPMRGATKDADLDRMQGTISIHAPHARCDHMQEMPALNWQSISIHAPHARCDFNRYTCDRGRL